MIWTNHVVRLHFRFSDDIYQMTGYHPGPYWQWTWRYIGPVIMSCILVSSIVCLAIETPTYNAYDKELVSFSEIHANISVPALNCVNNICFFFLVILSNHTQSTTVKTEYPSWVMSIGLTMIVAGVLPIPIVYLLRRFQILKVDLG